MRVFAILPGVLMIVAFSAGATVSADGPDDDEGAATGRKGPPSADAIFSRIDRDDDGKISQEEFEAAFKRLRRMHPRWSEAPHGKEPHKQWDRDQPRQHAGRRDDWRQGPRHGPPHRGSDRGRHHGCCSCGQGGDRDGEYRHERGCHERRGPRGDRPRFSGPPRDIDRMQDRGPGHNFEAMFDRFDEDNNAKLTESEVPAPLWQRISRADKDGDQSVTKDEMRIAIKKRFKRMGRERADRGREASSDGPRGKGADRRRRDRPSIGQIFDRFDANNDGSLSEGEVPEGPWARMSRADKNGDGQVSKDELRSARKLRKKNRPGDAAGPAEKPDPSDASNDGDDDGDDDDDAS